MFDFALPRCAKRCACASVYECGVHVRAKFRLSPIS